MANSAINKGERHAALSRHMLFHSRDLDETRHRVAQVFCPHELNITERNQRLDTRMFHASLGGVSLNRLRYGATVFIDPGRLDNFFLVQMPLKGTAEIHCGTRSIRSLSTLPAVITPTLPLRMTWKGCCDQLVVRIDRALLERHCMHHLGHALRDPVEFDLGMETSRSRYDSWRQLIAFLVAEADRGQGILCSSLARAQLEQLVVTTLLLSQPNNYRDELLRPSPPIAPSYVKRVEEYIAAHADQPLTIVELAAHAGVSTRGLFAGFREFRNTSPMAYLKSIRLQRAHDDLAAATNGNQTVTRVAMRWGFGHLGHFTADYKHRFGESPSETLHQS